MNNKEIVLSPFEFFDGILPNNEKVHVYKIVHHSTDLTDIPFEKITEFKIYQGKNLVDTIKVNRLLTKNKKPCYVKVRMDKKYPTEHILFECRSSGVLSGVIIKES